MPMLRSAITGNRNRNPAMEKHSSPMPSTKECKPSSRAYWIEDGTFVRIKNIRLSYTIPKAITSRLAFRYHAGICECENVHVFSKYVEVRSGEQYLFNGYRCCLGQYAIPAGIDGGRRLRQLSHSHYGNLWSESRSLKICWAPGGPA